MSGLVDVSEFRFECCRLISFDRRAVVGILYVWPVTDQAGKHVRNSHQNISGSYSYVICCSPQKRSYGKVINIGWWFGFFLFFHSVGKNNPNWRTHIFQGGRSTSRYQPIRWKSHQHWLVNGGAFRFDSWVGLFHLSHLMPEIYNYIWWLIHSK